MRSCLSEWKVRGAGRPGCLCEQVFLSSVTYQCGPLGKADLVLSVMKDAEGAADQSPPPPHLGNNSVRSHTEGQALLALL